jgi:hypothetical protein
MFSYNERSREAFALEAGSEKRYRQWKQCHAQFAASRWFVGTSSRLLTGGVVSNIGEFSFAVRLMIPGGDMRSRSALCGKTMKMMSLGVSVLNNSPTREVRSRGEYEKRAKEKITTVSAEGILTPKKKERKQDG